MKRKRKQRSLKQTDYSVYPQCKHGKPVEMPVSQHILLLSALPWLVAFILTYFVHPIFIIFFPIIGLFNMKAAKQKPLRRCRSCHSSQQHRAI